MRNSICLSIPASVLACLLAVSALADVQIDASGERYELHASGETQRNVMDAMAERFEFEVVYPDQAWGSDARDFQKRGSLDDLLDYVLAGTNYVASYWRANEEAASRRPSGEKATS